MMMQAAASAGGASSAAASVAGKATNPAASIKMSPEKVKKALATQAAQVCGMLCSDSAAFITCFHPVGSELLQSLQPLNCLGGFSKSASS